MGEVRKLHDPQSGFTLLEILIVVALMGIILGMAVLAVGDGGRGRTVENQARRLKGALALAAQESILDSRVLGAEISADRYSFYRLRKRKWVLFKGDPAMGPATLPTGLRLRVHLQGAARTTRRAGPQIIFMADGEMSPFRISLVDSLSDAAYRITGAANGVLTLDDEHTRP